MWTAINESVHNSFWSLQNSIDLIMNKNASNSFVKFLLFIQAFLFLTRAETAFLPIDEAVAFRAVFVIVSG